MLRRESHYLFGMKDSLDGTEVKHLDCLAVPTYCVRFYGFFSLKTRCSGLSFTLLKKSGCRAMCSSVTPAS